MHGFRITNTRVDVERVVVSVFGEADLAVASELGSELTKAIDSSPRLLVIDLTGTTFIDSTALRVLIQSQRRLESLGGRICLVCPDRLIWKIFEITRLEQVFRRQLTVSDALERETEGYAAVGDAGWEAPQAYSDTGPKPVRAA